MGGAASSAATARANAPARTESFVPGDQATLTGLRSSHGSALNGQTVEVQSCVGRDGRHEVYVESTGKVFAAKAENLARPAPTAEAAHGCQLHREVHGQRPTNNPDAMLSRLLRRGVDEQPSRIAATLVSYLGLRSSRSEKTNHSRRRGHCGRGKKRQARAGAAAR